MNPPLNEVTPSPPTLRPYQNKLIKDLYTQLAQGYRRVAIIAGTGAGKTVISGQICAHLVARGHRLLFLVHLDVLVGQTHEKMRAFGLRCGFIKAGWTEDPTAPIQIASIQTMAKRSWWREWQASVVFFDEGHTTVFSQVGQQVLYETHSKAVHLVMTATPYRLGREQLGDHLETLVASPVPAELQQMGFLAKMKYYGVPSESQIDLSNVGTVAGDYDERALKNACDRPELIQRIVDEWQRLTPGKRTIAFCVDIEHAHHVADAFRASGIPAATVAGDTPIKARHRLYDQLGSGNLLVLTSCNVISIGFDQPSVEVGLLLRPTQSRALHQQQIGRVMRISPTTGKSCGIILDQAGNLRRLGFPEDIKEYRLPTSSEPGEPGSAPLKQCPDCNRLLWTFVMQCPDCDYNWQVEQPTIADSLVEVFSKSQLEQLRQEKMIRFFRVQRRKMFQEKLTPQWVKRSFFEVFRSIPSDAWCHGSIFGDAPTLEEKQAFKEYLTAIAKQQSKSISWVVNEFQLEFGAENWQEAFL
jgi:superfamily II DNA or RNA helicase